MAKASNSLKVPPRIGLISNISFQDQAVTQQTAMLPDKIPSQLDQKRPQTRGR